MDWQTRLHRLLSDTEANLLSSQTLGGHWPVSPLTARKPVPGSYALLRQGVSPGDPHLIAPALPTYMAAGGGQCSPHSGLPLVPPATTADDLIPASRGALSKIPLAAEAENARVGCLRQHVSALGEQLREAAEGWQGVAATVAGAERKFAAHEVQLLVLGADFSNQHTLQGRLERAAEQQRVELQGQLATLGGRLDALSEPLIAAGGMTGATGAAFLPELALFNARLRQMELTLATLQAQIQQQAGAGGASADVAARLGALHGQLAALQGVQASTAQRQQSWQVELGKLASQVQAGSDASNEADRRSAALGNQLAALSAAQGVQEESTLQLNIRLEQLALELAGVSAKVEQRRQQEGLVVVCQQQHAQQERQQAGGAAASASQHELQKLAGQVQAGADALGLLQEQVAQLAGLQVAFDDANQRLFELRVEVQNASEDGAIATTSIKRQAEAAELRAEEAAEAAAGVLQLTASLHAAVLQAQQQMAALQEQTVKTAAGGGSDGGQRGWAADGTVPAPLAMLIQQIVAADVAGAVQRLSISQEAAGQAQTLDRLAVELAGIKLVLAQQQEVADGAAAAGRAAILAVKEQCVKVALEAVEQLVRQNSPAGLAAVTELTATMTTLSDIVHQQRVELEQVKQDLQGKHSVQSVQGAGTEQPWHASIVALQNQVAAAAAAGEQRQAAQAAKLAEVRQRLAVAQEAAAGAGALQQDVAALQRHLAAVEESVDNGLDRMHPALSALQQRLVVLEAAAGGRQGVLLQGQGRWAQQQGDAGEPDPAQATAAAAAASVLAVAALQARMEALEASLGGQLQQDASPAAVQHQLAAVQSQMAALVAASAAATPESQPVEQPGWGQLRQQLEGRVHRTEATMAAALEEVAAQMAALAARMERAEAAATASAASADVAGAAAAQHMAAAEGLTSKQQLFSPRILACGATLSCQPSLQRSRSNSVSRQQEAPASYADLHHQDSHSLSQQSELSGGGSAGVAPSSGGPGLFARLGRGFSLQGRRSTTGGLEAPAASSSGYSSSSGLEGESCKEGQEGTGGDGQLAGTLGRRISRRSSAGTASGSATPRQAGSSSSCGGGAPAKYTPRSRHWASLQQERSQDSASGVSPAGTPRQALSAFCSFGELPLAFSASASSALASPRESMDWHLGTLELKLSDPLLAVGQQDAVH